MLRIAVKKVPLHLRPKKNKSIILSKGVLKKPSNQEEKLSFSFIKILPRIKILFPSETPNLPFKKS